MSAYELLSKPIQQALWNMRWTELRPIQEQAIPIILTTDCDLVISARTAAGKTEAAFLPVLSAIQSDPASSIRAIYVGPLKALINDQFRRLEDLAALTEIPIHRWHGDVDGNKKVAATENPAGVLLITPESLEAMFVNRGNRLEALFHNLSFVVLDELHVMLGTERGLQLRSLMYRLQRIAKSKIRIVGLSATLGDLPKTAAWISPESPASVKILTDEATQKAIKFRIHAYLMPLAERHPNQEPESSTEAKTAPESEQAPDAARTGQDAQTLRSGMSPIHSEQRFPTEQGAEPGPEPLDAAVPFAAHGSRSRETVPSTQLPQQMLADMYEYFHGQKTLIFANAKAQVELCAEGLNKLCAQDGRRPEFLVHHGSLSKEIREETETLMQNKQQIHSAVCSATMELGIDIGNVAAVGQIGSPHSVNSQVQRLGRSGRKDHEPHCMRVFIKCTDWPATATLQDRLFPELIQSVALTELMLQKWFEPPELGQGDFSTLVQQILSILAQTGGARAIELFQRLVQEGAFRYLDQPTFGSVLRSLAEHDLIEQMPEGDLILGLKGQQIVSHYDFYSAFMTAIEYRVLYQSRLIGMLSPENISQTGDAILLGGRSWRIADVDHPRREVYVVPAAASKAPLFPPSERLVHQRVREEMRQILGAEQSFAYLSDQGTELLTRARDAARNSDALTRKILQLDKTKCLWLPWIGTRGLKTLRAFCSLADLKARPAGNPVIGLEFSLPAPDVLARLSVFLKQPPTALQLAEQIQPKQSRKYDRYLTEDLLNLSVSREVVDLEPALQALRIACGVTP